MTTATSVIRRYREDNALTQQEMGARVGVTAATISRWEQGLREPRGTWRQRLAEVIGVPEAAIIESPSTSPGAPQ